MKLYLGSDHAGFALKEHLKNELKLADIEIIDTTPIYKEGDDYPEALLPVAMKMVEEAETAKAIVIGGSGQGEAIFMNRFPGVRAAVFYGGPHEILKLSREHNDANVLSLGARFMTGEEAVEAVTLWLGTAFSHDERHARRIELIDSVE